MAAKIDPVRIRHTSVAGSVADKLLEMVQNGTFAVGDALPTEKELTGIFGVGRSTVREAMTALQSAGIVERRQGNGTYVTAAGASRDSCFSVKRILQRYSAAELSEARLVLEEQIAGLSAAKAAPDDVEAMEAANRKLAGSRSCGEKEKIVELDFDVHRAIAEGAQNIFLQDMLGTLLEAFAELNLAVLTADKTDAAVAWHGEVIACIRRGDAAGAQRQMRRHLTEVNDRMLREIYEDKKETAAGGKGRNSEEEGS